MFLWEETAMTTKKPTEIVYSEPKGYIPKDIYEEYFGKTQGEQKDSNKDSSKDKVDE